MSRPVVMHLRSAEFFGGPERAILGQCRALADFKFICASFVRGHGSQRFFNEAISAGFQVVRINDAFAGDFRVVGQIKNSIRENHVEILVCHDYKANFFGRIAAKKCGIPQISHFRGYTTEDRKVRLYNFINSVLLKKSLMVLAVSERSSQILQSRGVPAEDIKVVPNAIEGDKLVDDNFIRTIDTARPIRAVCAGRLSYEKGYDILIEAVAGLRDDAPRFTVDIYGHGPEKQKLQARINQHDLDEVVFLKGFNDNILPILKESDLLILPSRSEGMPNILLEGWSQKLGVVATSAGGVAEMIEDGVSGFLAPPGDAAALREKIKKALNNPGNIIEYGQVGYEMVRDKYNYHSQAEILRQIYGGLIGP